jgi:formylglycine-generating enzyme required for sulfatase activity
MTTEDQEPGKKSCCVPSRPRDDAVPRAPAPPQPAATGSLGDRRDAATLPGGTAIIGTDTAGIAGDGETPARKVTLRPFAIDRHAVSNARFSAFVAATGYVTEAQAYGWSYVFHLLLAEPGRHQAPVETPWWRKVDGACWLRPEGPGSDLAGRDDHPAVHISHSDAAAFAAWARGRLPSEAEWEYAALGGRRGARFPWGEEEPDDSRVFCNIWQGSFPRLNTVADGFLGTAPVESFAPNGYGLYNMVGNVWEWCAEPFRIRSLSKAAKLRNQEAAAQREHVMKGGSYLCHRSYCYRYRIAARTGRPADTSAGNAGFRVAYDVEGARP